MYDMPIDEFWHGEAELFSMYQVAYYRKRDERLDDSNFIAWLSGYYVRSALWEVHGIINSKEEDRDTIPTYFSEPLNVFDVKDTQETKNDIVDMKIKEENKVKLMVAQNQLALRDRKEKKVGAK